MNMFSYTSYGLTLLPEFEMSNALSYGQTLEVEQYKWIADFNYLLVNKGMSLPRPGIYKTKPCFLGGLYPIGCKPIHFDDVCIFDSSLSYKIVSEKEVRMPNDNEYNVFFRTIFCSGIAKIVSLRVKDDPFVKEGEYVFISLDDKRYKNFNEVQS